MTKYVVEESGDFRRGEEGVFNGDECIFMAPPAQFVPQLMDDLFAWMKEEKNNVHPLICGKKGKQTRSPLLIQIREELGECYVKIISDAVRHLDGGILGTVFDVADCSPATINRFC